jgi:hypothetical protein
MGRQATAKRQRHTAAPLPPWTPFQRDRSITLDELLACAHLTAERLGLTLEQARAHIIGTYSDEVYINSRYRVVIRHQPGYVHLSFNRCGGGGIGPERWRDFQRIKNELVGPEHEAVELYPAETRVRDTSNTYHLWVLDKPFPLAKFDIGFWGPRTVLDRAPGSITGSEQLPLDPDQS